MSKTQQIDNRPCPHLPSAPANLRASWPRRCLASQPDSNPVKTAYLAHLETAQSLWLQQLPGQAILQLNKVFALPTCFGDPLRPYQALIWILKYPPPKGFIGNPVRHFQHLAARIRIKARNDLARRYRAWICFHLAEQALDPCNFPRDDVHLQKDKLLIPAPSSLLDQLAPLAWPGEIEELPAILL